MELISVVVPAYNAQKYIGRTVQSVLQQSYSYWELILVSDDGYDYQSFLEQHGIRDKRISYHSTGQIAGGVVNARGIGIAHAQGDLIAVLDSDDCFTPRKLELCLPKVLETGLVSCALEIRDQQENHLRFVGTKINQTIGAIINASAYKRIHFSTDSVILFDRRKIPVKIANREPWLEDLNFVMHCFEYVDHLYYFNQPLHIYYKDKTSMSSGISASKSFINMKKSLLTALKSGVYKFKSDATQKALTEFLEISLKAEFLFLKKQKIGSDVLFEDILERLLLLY